MAFVWLLPAALHSGAPVGLSLVDRGVVFQSSCMAPMCLISRCGAERHSSVPAALDCFCHMWGGEELATVSTTCRPPQEKLHGIRVVVTGCLAQRRTPVGLSLVDRGAVFQMPAQLQHGAHCGLDQQMRRLGFLPKKKPGGGELLEESNRGEARTGRMGRGVDKLLDGCLR